MTALTSTMEYYGSGEKEEPGGPVKRFTNWAYNKFKEKVPLCPATPREIKQWMVSWNVSTLMTYVQGFVLLKVALSTAPEATIQFFNNPLPFFWEKVQAVFAAAVLLVTQ